MGTTGKSEMGTTEKLANFVVDTTYNDFPPDTIRFAKELMLSTIGATVGGSTTSTGKIVIKHVKEIGGVPEASVMGAGFRTSVVNAAFVHGTTPHSLEVEDDSFPGAASVMTVLPVVLAFGEKLKLSAKEVIEGFVVGFEVQGKMAFATPGAEAKGVNPLTAYGTMGAAAAAAKMLKLNVDQTRFALSLAASQVGGLTAQLGTMAHYFESGAACRDGVVAAMLAKDNFTAAMDVIEAPIGLENAIFGKDGYDLSKMTSDLGNPFHIHYVNVKNYPCCYMSHRVLDSVYKLMKENNISYEQIESIEGHCGPSVPRVLRNPVPQTVEEAKFSLEFPVAAMMLEGKVVLGTFVLDKILDPKFREAASKVKLVNHPDWPDGLMAGKDTTVMKLKDGREFTEERFYQRGSPELPLTREEIVEKYRDCSSLALPEKEMEAVQQIVLNLDKAKDVQELMNLLSLGAK